ncbi:YtxH domain-containing protein [Paenibacillus yanchengensis]|uniref:YtxH domain-containing protein n=1 Tax=Paenibacillus yanchengensis TaxID=2035833 RepID=A0ABW4YIV8_9BACL
MANETKSSGLLLGTLIGGTAGVIAALLLAPKSGAEMREDLSNNYQTLCNKTKNLVTSAGDTTKEVVGTVKEEAASLAKHAKESNQNIKETISSSAEDMKDKLATDK